LTTSEEENGVLPFNFSARIENFSALPTTMNLERVEHWAPLLRGAAILSDLCASGNVAAAWFFPAHLFLSLKPGLFCRLACLVST
jgi:hypothetical protein